VEQVLYHAQIAFMAIIYLKEFVNNAIRHVRIAHHYLIAPLAFKPII